MQTRFYIFHIIRRILKKEHTVVEQIAKMIDHSLLHPTMTDVQLAAGCEVAKQCHVASVCIKPYAVKQAMEWLNNSDVRVGTVIGFPHGNSTISVKVFETEQVCRDGADEVDMVVNIGQVLSGNWLFVEKEISMILDACHKHKGILKVIFENDFLPGDEYKIKLCKICSKLGVEFVKTSTGYGFIQGTDKKYSYRGATDEDLILMRKHCAAAVQVKAAGGVRTLDDLLRVRALGVTRVGTTATVSILEEAKLRFA
jgi:deoxyribose-phosphate aldolase